MEKIVQRLDEMNHLITDKCKEAEDNRDGMSIDHIPQIIICDLFRLCTKRHPKKAQRLKPGYEDTQASGKKRMCSLYHEKNHYFIT